MRKKHNHPPRVPKTQPSPDPALQLAIAHHQAGRLAEAEAGYREVLAAEPANAVAMHLLGVLAYQAHQCPLALQLIDAALQSNPQYAEAHANRGIVLHAMQQYSAAIESYDKAITLNPEGVEAYNNRGNSLQSLKQYQAALESCDRAIALLPGYAEAWNNRGNALHKLMQFAEAVASYDKAIALQPNYADAYSNRGNVLQAVNLRTGNFDKHDTTGRDLVFYCAPMIEVWNPDTARASGIGGSEESIIWLARLLHRRGWNVTVYANCGIEERVYEGVRWRPYWMWNCRDRQDATILWRYPHLVDNEINSGKIFVDLHDVIPASEFSFTRIEKIDKIFVKSNFHRSLFPDVPDEKFVIVPNGIDATLFEHTGERDPLLLINTSSADRSLEAFLDCFDEIRKQVPAARAQWAYGWGVWDTTHAASAEKMAWKTAMQTRMRALGVTESGRLSHDDVAALYRRGSIFAYPSEMAEVDCISLSKAMAAGAIPITTDFAALGEKAGHGGFFIHSQKTKDDWTQSGQFHFEITDPAQKVQFVDQAVELLRNHPDETQREPMREWARRTFEWNAVADAWHLALAGHTHHQAALDDYHKALALNPMLAEAHNNRGSILRSLLDYESALACFDKAIELKPEYADAHNNRGSLLLTLKDFSAALASFERTLAIQPDFEFALGMRLYLKRLLCNWSDSAVECGQLEAAILNDERAALPFATLALCELPAVQRRAAEIYALEKHPQRIDTSAMPPHAAHEKIRIGYFSADFYNHATSYLMAELFELHDRTRFEIIGFSFGPPAIDEMGRRVSAAMDRFIDVHAMSDTEIAQLSRGLEVDIAIDLKGYTRGHRAGIFAERAAPVQASYVAYPGTMGAPYIDYLIADRTVIPDDLRQHYTEKIVALPGSYQPNDSRRHISATPATRVAAGLPEAAFVFCCFNNAYKITPQVFESWMRILTRVEGSVLWLLEENATSSANLRAQARSRGVSPDRVVFARPIALSEHLARLGLADLFLDTLPYNAHTTASDALWVGVPVLTRIGETFAGRVAASLLRAVGLPELITHAPQEFEQLAVDLAHDHLRMHILRERLRTCRDTAPLFDTAAYARHLEAAYLAMYWRHTAGLAPDDLNI